MASESALAAGLEGLGLSAYEARAYVTLITRGTMQASDLAFYSGIPRTKIYSIIKKLAGKGLATYSNSKSVMACTAVQPGDAFDLLIHKQIQKVEAMNSLVAELKKAGEEGRRTGDSEEKRYVQVGPGRARGQLQEMIDGARASVTATADGMMLALLAECREQIRSAMQKRGVVVRCAIPPDQVCSDAHRALPSGVECRMTGAVPGCIIFDKSEIMMLDGAGGRAAVFSSAGMLADSQAAMFEGLWARAMRVDALADMTAPEARRIFRIMDTVGRMGLQYALGGSGAADTGAGRSRKPRRIPDMYGLLEREGIGLAEGTEVGEAVGVLDAIMRISCAGSASVEAGGRSIRVESSQNGAGPLPWVAILEGWLRRSGYSASIATQPGGAPGGGGTIIRVRKN